MPHTRQDPPTLPINGGLFLVGCNHTQATTLVSERVKVNRRSLQDLPRKLTVLRSQWAGDPSFRIYTGQKKQSADWEADSLGYDIESANGIWVCEIRNDPRWWWYGADWRIHQDMMLVRRASSISYIHRRNNSDLSWPWKMQYLRGKSKKRQRIANSCASGKGERLEVSRGLTRKVGAWLRSSNA